MRETGVTGRMEAVTGFFLSIIWQNNGFFGMRQMGGDGFGFINNVMSDGVTKVSIKNAFFLPHFCAVRTMELFQNSRFAGILKACERVFLDNNLVIGMMACEPGS